MAPFFWFLFPDMAYRPPEPSPMATCSARGRSELRLVGLWSSNLCGCLDQGVLDQGCSTSQFSFLCISFKFLPYISILSSWFLDFQDGSIFSQITQVVFQTILDFSVFSRLLQSSNDVAYLQHICLELFYPLGELLHWRRNVFFCSFRFRRGFRYSCF
jgi:hypothetical protein